MMKVEMHNVDSFIACFWHTGDRQWEGIVTDELNNMEVNIIKSDQAILLLRKSDCVQRAQVSNESSREPR